MLEVTLLGFARAVTVAIATVGLASIAAPVLRSSALRLWQRAAMGILFLLPCFAPVLLVGFAYSRWSLSLVHYPLLRELFYLLILILKVAPVGVILHWFFPPALGDSGRHCFRLARLPLRYRLRLAGDTSVIVFSVALLLAFHDFELASLLGIDVWTVRLFDAHVGGIPWNETMEEASLPLVLQIGMTGALVWMMAGRFRSLSFTSIESMRTPGRSRVIIAWSLAVLIAGGFVLLPVAIVSKDAFTGMAQMHKSFALKQEILSSLLFAGSSGLLAFSIGHSIPFRMLVLIAVPGLLGSLTIAMMALPLFQLEGLHRFYDSPVPLIVVLVALLLPFACLLQFLRNHYPKRELAHVAQLSGARRPKWITQWRGGFVSLLILFVFGFADLTASAILAPPGMTTAPARLYNLMHYGQTAVLAAMSLSVLLLPLLIAGISWFCAEWLMRRRC